MVVEVTCIGSPTAACSSPADSATGGSWTNRESLVSRRIHRTPARASAGSSASGAGAGIGGSSRSCIHEKHRIVSPRRADARPQPVSWQTQFAGAALRILRSSLGRGRAPRTPKRASGASARNAHHHPQRSRRAAVRAQRVRGARPVFTGVGLRPSGPSARAEGVFHAADRLFHVPRRVGQHDPRPLRHPLHHGLLRRNHG